MTRNSRQQRSAVVASWGAILVVVGLLTSSTTTNNKNNCGCHAFSFSSTSPVAHQQQQQQQQRRQQYRNTILLGHSPDRQDDSNSNSNSEDHGVRKSSWRRRMALLVATTLAGTNSMPLAAQAGITPGANVEQAKEIVIETFAQGGPQLDNAATTNPFEDPTTTTRTTMDESASPNLSRKQRQQKRKQKQQEDDYGYGVDELGEGDSAVTYEDDATSKGASSSTLDMSGIMGDSSSSSSSSPSLSTMDTGGGGVSMNRVKAGTFKELSATEKKVSELKFWGFFFGPIVGINVFREVRRAKLEKVTASEEDIERLKKLFDKKD
eukprot:scaffold8349_cov42-Attheya_sp.AAC.2